VKFGVGLFPLRPWQVVEVTTAAESLGYDSVWLGEHVVTPVVSDSRFPYADDDDHQAFHGQLPFLDPYATLSFLAAKTSTIKLAVSVSIVPLHDPFHLARQVMTTDIYAGGRFLFGIGSGWLEEEFDILGKDFARRGLVLDETLDIMDRLFVDEVITYDGKVFQVPPIGMEPKPVTQPHPPYIFGGLGPKALKRAARRGQGWLASGMTPNTVAEASTYLRTERAELGLEDPFEISAHVVGDVTAQLVEEYRDAGADRLIVRPWMKGSLAVEAITRLASELEITAP
jgi:probable F420-dependent oxidoreductase